MAVRSDSMWCFDHLGDALEYITMHSRTTHTYSGAPVFHWFSFRLYAISPTEKPRKIEINEKLMGYQAYPARAK